MRLFKKEKKKERKTWWYKAAKKVLLLKGTKTGLKTSMKFSQTSWQRAEKLHKVLKPLKCTMT